jgi:hypothetical protein
VSASRHYIWAIHAVEEWSSRPVVARERIKQVLRRVEARALAQAGIDPARASGQPTGNGAVLALPGDVRKEAIAIRYLEALREGIEDHDAECGAAETIRLRLALHAGAAGPDEWTGPGIASAARLLDAPVLHRVLAAATGSALVLIVSDDWYRATVTEGYAAAEGYRPVRLEASESAGHAWIRVPGRSEPPGLTPGDHPQRGDRSPGVGQAAPAADHPAWSGSTISNSGRIGGIGDFRGAHVEGDVSFGNNYYGADGPRRDGGAR